MTTSGRIGGGTPGDAERDLRLDRFYRETGREEPPARLDAAILAAARREVGARPRAVSARLRGWRVPVSIAAVVVLSVSLVTLIREEGGGQLPPVADGYSKPAEAGPPAPAAPGAEKALARAKEQGEAPAAGDDTLGAAASAKVADETARRPERAQRGDAAVSLPQAPPPPAAAPLPQPFPSAQVPIERLPPAATDQAAGADTTSQAMKDRGGAAELAASASAPAEAPKPAARAMVRDRAAAGEGAAGSVSGARPSSAEAPLAKREARSAAGGPQSESAPAARVAALLKTYESEPPGKWLEKIEALRREGRTEESDAMLAEFKRRFPGHAVPPGLR